MMKIVIVLKIVTVLNCILIDQIARDSKVQNKTENFTGNKYYDNIFTYIN